MPWRAGEQLTLFHKVYKKGAIGMERMISFLAGYLCGNFLTAELLSRKKAGKSAFGVGTGNPGMANMMRQYGFRDGLLVLAGDVGKTLLACLACRFLLFPSMQLPAALYSGLGCVTGHNFPAWHKFRGGKGVACTCAALVCISPLWGLLACIAGLVGVILTKYLPVGAVMIPAVFLFPAFGIYGAEAGIITAVLALLMLIRHYPGLKNIPTGTEPQIDLLKRLRRGK